MPRKMKVDYAKLLKMVKDEVAQKEIMDKFGFKNSTQLKNALANAAMEKGLLPKLVGGRGGGSKPAVSRRVKVNSRGSLVVPKKLTEVLGLGSGEEFEVRKSKAGLSLKKV